MKKFNYWILLVLSLALFAGGVLFRQQRISDNVTPITFEQLMKMKNENTSYLIYVGRDSCEDCQKYQRKLYPTAFEDRVRVYHYDTTQDREKANFGEILDELSLKEVPALYVIGGGEIKKINPKIVESRAFDRMLVDNHLKN